MATPVEQAVVPAGVPPDQARLRRAHFGFWKHTLPEQFTPGDFQTAARIAFGNGVAMGQSVIPNLRAAIRHPQAILENPQAAFWGYLLWLAGAELLTAVVSTYLGVAAHTLLLIILLIHSGVARTVDARRLALALTLAPLIRLLSLTLPVLAFPQPLWYTIVAGPLLLAAVLATRQLGLGRAALGLVPGHLGRQLLLAGGGLGLGALEYTILRPHPIDGTFAWWGWGLLALNLLVSTGFTEEFIFRGVLQTVAVPLMRRRGLVYVALVFGILHIGYLSLTDLVFVTAVGLLFAILVRQGGSLLGVILAHGLTNITLFLIMPAAAQPGASPLFAVMPWLIAAGTLSGLLGAGLNWRAARTKERAAGSRPKSAPASKSTDRELLPALPTPPAAHREPQWAGLALAGMGATPDLAGGEVCGPLEATAIWVAWREELSASLLARAPGNGRGGGPSGPAHRTWPRPLSGPLDILSTRRVRYDESSKRQTLKIANTKEKCE